MSETNKKARVYIKNINFETTEKELEEFLKPFEPTHILIPTHTVRFNGAVRPLGIAYAEFKNSDQVQNVIKQLDGAVLKDRKLMIKQHFPIEYVRKHFGFRRMFRRGQSKNEASPADQSSTENITVTGSNKSSSPSLPDQVGIKNEAQVSDKDPTDVNKNIDTKTKELSHDTIYIPRAYYKITDEAIRDYFKDYCPSQIYIYRAKQSSVGFHKGYVSVLATLDTSVHSLSDIIKDLTGKKLVGRYVPLRIAFKSKIEEVKNAANSNDESLKNSPSTEIEGTSTANHSEVVPTIAEEEESIPLEVAHGEEKVAASVT